MTKDYCNPEHEKLYREIDEAILSIPFAEQLNEIYKEIYGNGKQNN